MATIRGPHLNSKENLCLRIDLSIDCVELQISRLLSGTSLEAVRKFEMCRSTNQKLIAEMKSGDIARLRIDQQINLLAVLESFVFEFRSCSLDDLLFPYIEWLQDQLLRAPSSMIEAIHDLLRGSVKIIRAWITLHHPFTMTNNMDHISKIESVLKFRLDSAARSHVSFETTDLISKTLTPTVTLVATPSDSGSSNKRIREQAVDENGTSDAKKQTISSSVAITSSQAGLLEACAYFSRSRQSSVPIGRLISQTIELLRQVFQCCHHVEMFVECIFAMELWTLDEDFHIALLEAVVVNNNNLIHSESQIVNFMVCVILVTGLLFRLRQLTTTASRALVRFVQVAHRLCPAALMQCVFGLCAHQPIQLIEGGGRSVSDAVSTSVEQEPVHSCHRIQPEHVWEFIQRCCKEKEMFSKDKDVDSVLNAIFAEVPPIDTSKLRRDQSMRLISLQELSIILDGALCAAAGSGFVSTVGRELRDFAPVASVEWDVFMMRQLKAILTMGATLTLPTIRLVMQSLDAEIGRIDSGQISATAEFWIALMAVVNALVTKYGPIIKTDELLKKDIRRVLAMMSVTTSTITQFVVMAGKTTTAALDRLK